jgi:hypothetical protein
VCVCVCVCVCVRVPVLSRPRRCPCDGELQLRLGVLMTNIYLIPEIDTASADVIDEYH